jgi:hypothetical protein
MACACIASRGFGSKFLNPAGRSAIDLALGRLAGTSALVHFCISELR